MREEIDLLSQRPRGYGADSLTSSFRVTTERRFPELTTGRTTQFLLNTQSVDYVSEQECTPLVYK